MEKGEEIMGYTIERIEQKECMSIWGDRPPKRDLTRHKDKKEVIEDEQNKELHEQIGG